MLIPIGDDKTGRQSAPFINYTLIAINIVVFFIELSLGNDFINGYAAIPYEIRHGVDLIHAVRVPGLGIIPEAPGPAPIYLTLLTSMFMHGGWLHIGFNMLFLWVFGDNVEDNFGHLKYLIFYLLCGLAAAFAQILPDPNSPIPSLGASGAIAGVLGAYMIMFPRNKVRVLLPLFIIWTVVRLPAILVIGFWIVSQLFSQFAVITSNTRQSQGGGVAYMAHIGGFFAGLILTFLFRNRDGGANPQYEYWPPPN
ncbi:MAG TPA: rhomboid family intramembrane serine protease [Blastocatellia bacterium]|nr:rhomboid family intramembrane serine protease [Blastocatellia bacterium]